MSKKANEGASQHDYFVRIDAAFAQTETRYSNQEWAALSDYEQLAALGLSDRSMGKPTRLPPGRRTPYWQERKARHREMVLQAIREYPRASGREIAVHTGLTVHIVSHYLKQLQGEGRVERLDGIRRIVEEEAR